MTIEDMMREYDVRISSTSGYIYHDGEKYVVMKPNPVRQLTSRRRMIRVGSYGELPVALAALADEIKRTE